MRRLLSLLALVAALAAAGCGSSKSPLDEGLGFLPKDAPFAVSISTDTSSGQYQSANKILKKFPFGDQALSSLKRRLGRGGVNFDRDVKPILGNPFVVGAPTPQALQGSSRNQFVAALKAKDSSKLDELIKKDAKEVGDKNGFKVYEDKSGDRFARKDDVVVFAGSTKLLDGALAQREAGNRLTEGDFDQGLKGLPRDAVVRVYGDAERLLKANPRSAQARKVKWVDSLRKFGLTTSIKDNAIDIGFNLQTDTARLSDADLPLAPGDQAPQVVKAPGEISFALRNAAQIEKFAEAASQTVNPAGYGRFQQGKSQIQRQLGIDVNRDIVDQLTGDVAATVTVAGKYGMRAQLKDPAAFRATLKKVAPLLPRIAKSSGRGAVGLAKPKRGQDFYALAQANGKSVVFGVVENAFVLANEPAIAGRMAAAAPTPVPGAQGSVVLSSDAQKLAGAIIGRLSPRLGSSPALGGVFTAPLGELSGSLKSSTAGLSGKLTLTFK